MENEWASWVFIYGETSMPFFVTGRRENVVAVQAMYLWYVEVEAVSAKLCVENEGVDGNRLGSI